MREYSEVPPEHGAVGGKAGPGKRFLGRFIDGLIMLIPAFVIGGIVGGGAFAMGTGASGPAFVAGVLAGLLSYAYFVFMESSQGATLGKKALGIRLVGAAGGNPTMEEAAKRNAWMLVAIVPVVGGFLQLAIAIAIGISISSDPQGRGYHDKWAGVTPQLTK